MERQSVLVVPTRTTEIDNLPPLPDMQVEVHAIAACTDAEILPEPVSWLDVMKALMDDKVYNVVHFCGHLADQQLILANERISIDGLVMMFRRSPAHRKLIFFNTCDSIDAAQRIATATPCDVIYTYGTIENDKAINFAIKFYSSLRTSETFKEAFDASVGDEKHFGYMKGVGKTGEEGEDGTPIVRGSPSDMTLMRADLNEIKQIMTGGILGRGLVWDVSEMKADHREFAAEFTEWKREFNEWKREFSEWMKWKPMLEKMYEASARVLSAGNNKDYAWLYILIAITTGLLISFLGQFLRGN